MGEHKSSKGSTSTLGSNPPAWATPGTDQFRNMNTTLQTAPMAVANQTFAQGGQGANTQQITPQLAEGSNFKSIFDRAGQPGAVEQNLAGTARGDFLNGSPFLDDIITRSNRAIGDRTDAMFSAGGRFGSGAHQGVLADSIGANTANILNQNFQSERDRQLQAASAIGNEQQGRMGQQLGAAGGLTQSQLGAAGLEDRGFQNMLGMISALPTIQNNKVFDANQQMQVGGMIDQEAQARLTDAINQWQRADMEPWARLGGLISGATGAAGNFGTQTGTAQTTTPFNPLQGLGLLGSIGMAPVTGGGSLLGNFASGLLR